MIIKVQTSNRNRLINRILPLQNIINFIKWGKDKWTKKIKPKKIMNLKEWDKNVLLLPKYIQKKEEILKILIQREFNKY
jgi:hypothetical protein